MWGASCSLLFFKLMNVENINSVSELEQFRSIIHSHFGYIPNNMVIVSKEIMKEVKMYNSIPQESSLSSIQVLGIKVMSDVAEVIE